MRAVIADDSLLLREGITRLLAEGGIEVAAGIGDAEALLAAVAKQQPDLAIIDVRMPPAYQDEGLRAAIEIRRRWPKVALLVLSQFVEERYATELLSSDTRAVGYLLKDRVADIDEFIEAARRVAAGGTALDPEVVRQLLARSRKADPLARLTRKEREVLGLMAEGRSNTAIAAARLPLLSAMGCTVRTHSSTSPRRTKVCAVRMPPGTPRPFPGFALLAHRVGQLLVVVDDEQFRVRPRDGFLPVGDEEGAQVVECFGEGALVGRGLRVACHVHPVGQHS